MSLPDNTDDYATLVRDCNSQREVVRLVAHWVLFEFDRFFVEFHKVPSRAQQAFEQRDHRQSIGLSAFRLSLYSDSVDDFGRRLRIVFPVAAGEEKAWQAIERAYLPLIERRYEADIAIAYYHSVRRKAYQGEWWPVDYSFGEIEAETAAASSILCTYPGGEEIDVQTAAQILCIPQFQAKYRDLHADARGIAQRATANLRAAGVDTIRRIEVINAGFYRNRGAYLVGRLLIDGSVPWPFIVALLNGPEGIYVDALITKEIHAHNIFSSTLANFHVANQSYHELCLFLHSIMPARPLGLHYSTVGYNHFGKVAVMNELRAELENNDQVFEESPGFKGTVAMGFAAPTSSYHLKVIRDHPTEDYKWGEFEGLQAVLDKYRRVHEINRTGSMLDNIIYYNLKLERSWFNEELLRELLTFAGESVSIEDEQVIFRHLIVQRRLTPLPVYLQNADPEHAREAIVNLGYCIKNNAAANIFNKDLDARNYGVSRHLKVYLYDYDAVEPFVDVKVRSNADRFDGEEDVPDWYFEEGEVFLPDEIEVGLRIADRSLRRVFRGAHGDLYQADYWERVQRQLLDGKVPGVRTYPESQQLHA